VSLVRALVVLLAAVLVGQASAASAVPRPYPRPGPVGTVATSGFDIAYAMALPRGCNEVHVWSSRGTDRRIARQCFESTSTGSGIASVAYTRGRALWLSYTGGNFREWMLWTKGAGKARRLGFEAVPVEDPAPFVVAQSSEWALAYAQGERIVAFDERGRRLFAYDAGSRVVSLTTQQYGVGAVLESGRAIGLAYDGKLVATRDFAAREAQVAELTVQGLLVKTRTQVVLNAKSFAVPAGSRWQGFASGTFAYAVGNALYLGRISDGEQALVRRFGQRFVAQVGRITLATASGRVLTRERRADAVSRLFG
jgi:hypothetical protein